MNMINSNNSDNLTAGNRNSTNMIFTKTDGNGLIDSENLSITQSDQVSESPIYTNYSNQDIKTSKASCEIPADECWLFKPPKLHQTQVLLGFFGSDFLLAMDSDLPNCGNSQTDVTASYEEIKKVCENYEKFTGSDISLSEFYSEKLKLNYIRDDYETIKYELSLIKTNCQRARNALLAAGFQCPDDSAINSHEDVAAVHSPVNL
ncbi:unnamed protein product [Heterobilharzia americana]|nr:unnamed protein product [Heterobilharzia americana]